MSGLGDVFFRGEKEVNKMSEEIEQFEALLREIKIEATGPAEVYQQLADAVFEAVDTAVRRIADGLHLKLFECDEEPDSINYAKGTGFSWTTTTWCIGIVAGYHVIAEVVEGYNGGRGEAILRSIELVQGDPNERD
jgi:hypothetical protein